MRSTAIVPRPGRDGEQQFPQFTADLIRPDDLLSLHIAGYNLNISKDMEQPHLIRIDDSLDSYLVVTFPPQSIEEAALFEGSPIKPLAPPDSSDRDGDPVGTPTPIGPIPQPGQFAARIAEASRLVFRLAANAPMPTIPYTIEGLLNWSGMELSVTPLADLPRNPDANQVAQAPAIRPPDLLETAIELPYRLLLSPDHSVTWLHTAAPVTHRGRTELWHTRLALRQAEQIVPLSRSATAPLRAVWSPDYNPDTPPARTRQDLGVGRTAITPNDRHQIVVLTSAFSGYETIDNHPKDYRPLPIEVEQLLLSSLGGWLKSRGSWNPPRPKPTRFIPSPLHEGEVRLPFLEETAKPAITHEASAQPGIAINPAEHAQLPVVPIREHAGPPLDLSEWVHIATQGRDHYVRIVYEGHLYPFGHHASLVKVTERQIRDVNNEPVACLVQHMFIVVREPEKDYAREPYPHRPGVTLDHPLGMPLKRIRLTTLVTPDIDEPAITRGPGKSVIIPGTGYSFWIRVADDYFKFHAVAEDYYGNRAEFTAPLIFMTLSDAPLSSPPFTAYDSVRQAYNTSGSIRACIIPGQKLAFAEPDTSTGDNTTLTTQALYFDTEQVTGAIDAGGFLPTLYKADVQIPAAQQLLGANVSTTIKLYPDYVSSGFHAGNKTGIFAQIVKDTGTNLVEDQLPIPFSADKAGGIATPNLGIGSLSRALGPLAGKVTDLVSDHFDPKSFFPPKTAQLFGVIDLGDLIPGGGTASGNAPKMQTQTLDMPPAGKRIVTTLDWSPNLPGPGQDIKVGILKFKPEPGAALTIQARIEKPIALDPPAGGQPASFEFNGKLTNFTLDFLEVIALHFTSFAFTARAGQKLNVDVKLDDADPTRKPVEFEGDLDFVNKLSEIIPAGAFGDGPSLDVTAEGVHVGYGIGLPPAQVGVFALQNVNFSAGLTLPFSNGQPLLDFGFAERHHPFLLTVEALGGGGFLHLQFDTGGITMLEAAFEFGASVDLDLGVASGGVHIMAGIYFAMQEKNGQKSSLLSGYLRCGGELSVLGLISVSVEFNLSFTYDGGSGKASGRATLTVEVSVAFFSKSVELTVERSFGKDGHDPSFGQLIDTAGVWEEYASAFA